MIGIISWAYWVREIFIACSKEKAINKYPANPIGPADDPLLAHCPKGQQKIKVLKSWQLNWKTLFTGMPLGVTKWQSISNP